MKNRMLNISEIPTPMLLQIRRILSNGVEATAEAKELKKLQAENAALKRESKWRAIVESYDIEWGDDGAYWLSFASEDRLTWICEKLANARKEMALAEITGSVPLKIPPIRFEEQPSGIEFIRTALKERKHGNRET